MLGKGRLTSLCFRVLFCELTDFKRKERSRCNGHYRGRQESLGKARVAGGRCEDIGDTNEF